MAGDIRGFVRGTSELDAAGFAAAARVDLGFNDHDGRLQTMRRFAGLFLGEGHLTAGSGNAVAREDGFGLILVNLHRGPCSVWPKSGQPVLEFAHLQNTEVYSEGQSGARTRQMRERVNLKIQCTALASGL